MQKVYVISDREMAELQSTQEILFALTDHLRDRHERGR